MKLYEFTGSCCASRCFNGRRNQHILRMQLQHQSGWVDQQFGYSARPCGEEELVLPERQTSDPVEFPE